MSTGVGAKIQEHPGSSGRLAPVVEARIENPDGHGNGRIFIRSPTGAAETTDRPSFMGTF